MVISVQGTIQWALLLQHLSLSCLSNKYSWINLKLIAESCHFGHSGQRSTTGLELCTTPTQESRDSICLDQIGSWNLAWKLYVTQLFYLAIRVATCKSPENAVDCYNLAFWRRSLPTHRFACLFACLFQLAAGEVSLTILTSNMVGEYRRVFYNYPGTKDEQCHTQTI